MAKPVQTIAQKLFSITTASQHCAHVLERWEIFFRPPTATPIATASMDLIYGD